MKIPKKYQGHGLSWNKKKEKFQSRIYNKLAGRVTAFKYWEETDIDEVFKLHLEFKEDTLDNNFQPPPNKMVIPGNLKGAFQYYIDWLSDAEEIVPVFERRYRSKRHIKDQLTYLKRFLDVVKSKKINPENIIPETPKEYVGWFHDWLVSKGYANKTYNHHMKGLRYCYRFLQKNEIVTGNPFENIALRKTFTDPTIITEEEFKKLLEVTTEDNGWGIVSGQRRQWYKEWIPVAFKLALFTGERRDGLFLLKADHIEGNYLKIPNWKVNRNPNSAKEEKHSWVIITEDLAELLAELPLEGYLIAPDLPNRNTLKEHCSKAFAHFWGITGLPKKEFKALRKTYETRIVNVLGDKSKYLERHASSGVKIEHYLGRKEIQAELLGERLFDI